MTNTLNANPSVAPLSHQLTLSAFADEIALDFDEQLAVLAAEDIHWLELRSAWGKNVTTFEQPELERIAQALRNCNIHVSAIGSPIGKSLITDPFDRELRRFVRTLEIACFFGTSYIRIFSFFLPPNTPHRQHRDEVLRRLEHFANLAQRYNITLLHENEKEIYGDTAERCADLLTTIGAPNLQAAFDPANFVQCGVKPFTEAYPLLRPYIAYLHIKDARFADGQVVVAGAGDGEVAEVLTALHSSGYVGYASLEPHLSASGRFNGFTGPQLFREAVAALRRLLEQHERGYVN